MPTMPAQAPLGEQGVPNAVAAVDSRRAPSQHLKPARPVRGAAHQAVALGQPVSNTTSDAVTTHAPVLTPEPSGPSGVPALSVTQPGPPNATGSPTTNGTPLPPKPTPSTQGKPSIELTRAPSMTVPENTVSAPNRMPRTPAIQGPRPEPPSDRPRGLRKLLAMMTCSGNSATQAAALDEPAQPAPSHGAPASPKHAQVASSPSTATMPSKAESNDGVPGMLGTTGSLQKATVTEPEAGLPSRDSVIGPPSTATHGEETDEYGGGIIASVGQTGGLPMPYDTDLVSEQEMLAEEQRLINQGGTGLLLDERGNPRPLLPPPQGVAAQRKCLVLDLDETLVHSSFKMVPNADFIVPVEIDGVTHSVYVIKRPGVDEFMRQMGELYEVVIFTASLNKYADPVIDILDIHHVVHHRLFRESCYNHHGNYVKDLSQLGRPLHDTIILDNSPASYIFHPTNAVPVSSWFNDPHDTELTDLCPFLEDLCDVNDIRIVLDGFIHPD